MSALSWKGKLWIDARNLLISVLCEVVTELINPFPSNVHFWPRFSLKTIDVFREDKGKIVVDKSARLMLKVNSSKTSLASSETHVLRTLWNI